MGLGCMLWALGPVGAASAVVLEGRSRSNCTGYLVQGAGDTAVNGCYKPVGECALVCSGWRVCGQRPGFALDSTHQLYSWDKVWKLGLCGKSVSYAATHQSLWPPAGGTGCGESWEAVPNNVDAFEGGKNRGGPCKGGWLASHYPVIGAHGDWSSDWNVFQLDWTETWITMSVNGKLYANYDRNASGGELLPALNQPMFLWLTACVMNRVLPTAQNVFPLEYLVDYVKVWEWDI